MLLKVNICSGKLKQLIPSSSNAHVSQGPQGSRSVRLSIGIGSTLVHRERVSEARRASTVSHKLTVERGSDLDGYNHTLVRRLLKDDIISAVVIPEAYGCCMLASSSCRGIVHTHNCGGTVQSWPTDNDLVSC